MKLGLIVLSPGSSQGKSIPVKLTQFIIGRDKGCHLRLASVLISQRHCALLLRSGQVFVRDFDSTNGTLVNDRQIKGEVEVIDGDRLKVGPLELRVQIESEVPGAKPATPPATVVDSDTVDDAAAAALLMTGEPAPAGSPAVDSEGVPTGDTALGMAPPEPPPVPAKTPAEKARPPAGNTTDAAKRILDMYLKRKPK